MPTMQVTDRFEVTMEREETPVTLFFRMTGPGSIRLSDQFMLGLKRLLEKERMDVLAICRLEELPLDLVEMSLRQRRGEMGEHPGSHSHSHLKLVAS